MSDSNASGIWNFFSKVGDWLTLGLSFQTAVSPPSMLDSFTDSVTGISCTNGADAEVSAVMPAVTHI